MHAAERPEFTPPPEGGLPRSVGLALLAHAVLVLALSWGIKWKRDNQDVAAEAELWAATPQQAAPKPVEPPPAPPPQVAPPPPPPAPPAPREADIALEKEKERQALEKARREEAERQKLAAQKKREEEAAEKKREEEAARKLAAAKQAEERKKQEQLQAKRQQAEEKERERARKDQMDRIAGLAGATGARTATGTAMQSAGPSASYAGRLAALFQRNVVFPGGVETIAGNPEAELRVQVSPSGMILSVRLIRSSGNPEWDQAAVRAIERTSRIPPDEDGRFQQDFAVGLRPKPR